MQRDKVNQKRKFEELEKTLEEAQNGVRLESERRGEAEGNYILIKNEMQSEQQIFSLFLFLALFKYLNEQSLLDHH